MNPEPLPECLPASNKIRTVALRLFSSSAGSNAAVNGAATGGVGFDASDGAVGGTGPFGTADGMEGVAGVGNAVGGFGAMVGVVVDVFAKVFTTSGDGVAAEMDEAVGVVMLSVLLTATGGFALLPEKAQTSPPTTTSRNARPPPIIASSGAELLAAFFFRERRGRSPNSSSSRLRRTEAG